MRRDDQSSMQKHVEDSAKTQVPSNKCIPVSDEVAEQICNMPAHVRRNCIVVGEGDAAHLEHKTRVAGPEGVAINEDVFRKIVESREAKTREVLREQCFRKVINNASKGGTNLSDDELRALGFDLPEVRVSEKRAGFFPSGDSRHPVIDSAAASSASAAGIHALRMFGFPVPEAKTVVMNEPGAYQKIEWATIPQTEPLPDHIRCHISQLPAAELEKYRVTWKDGVCKLVHINDSESETELKRMG